MNIVDIGNRVGFHKLSTWALAGAGSGLLAEVAFLPSPARGFLLLAFILLGPGSAALQRIHGLPTVAVRALVPVTGLALVLLTVSGALLMGVWSSRLILLALAVLTAMVALLDMRRAGIAAAVAT